MRRPDFVLRSIIASIASDASVPACCFIAKRASATGGTVFSAILVVIGTATLAHAQEPPKVEPTAEHQWLAQFEGDWDVANKVYGPDGAEIMTCQGAYAAQMLGSFWLIGDATGEMAGETIHAVQTLGYDPKSKKYVGTWIDSVSDHMWKYEGAVDKAANKLVLEAEGPNFMADGKLTKFRDAYEFKAPDHIVATSSILSDDGEWVDFMKGDMRRAEEQ